jgi:hypothetical protein
MNFSTTSAAVLLSLIIFARMKPDVKLIINVLFEGQKLIYIQCKSHEAMWVELLLREENEGEDSWKSLRLQTHPLTSSHRLTLRAFNFIPKKFFNPKSWNLLRMTFHMLKMDIRAKFMVRVRSNKDNVILFKNFNIQKLAECFSKYILI